MEDPEEPFYMVRHKGLHLPGPLTKGDKIGIVTLSGYEPDEVMGAMAVIASHGFVPVLSRLIQNSDVNSDLLPRGERISELYYMIEDSEIKAIFCCGDGSGSIEMLPNFSYGPIARNPKWLVGNGDVTALLSMWVVSDIASIYGPMCMDLASGGAGVKLLFTLLTSGGKLDYLLPSSPDSRKGKATGRLVGGNLSVLTILGETSYDLVKLFTGYKNGEKGIILFVEDSDVPLTKVRDMLLKFYLNNVMSFVKGMIFGSFNNCEHYGHLHSIRDVVEELEERLMIPAGIPVAFDFPIGKDTPNIPLVEGLEVELEVSDNLVALRASKS